jgi:glycosyltransferase involved in cell wall biosynthesis
MFAAQRIGTWHPVLISSMTHSTVFTILHVETGRQLYGGPLQVLYLMRGLKARGYHNVLVCAQDAAIATAARDCADKIVPVRMGGDLDLGFISRLRAVLRESRPHIVHLHSRRGADILGAIAARQERVPVVLSRRVDNPEWSPIARVKYRLYDHVVTISRGIYNVLLAEGVPAHKMSCVLDAVDAERFAGAADRAWFEREFNLPAGVPTIGMVAQFIERKGHRYLLDAAPSILEQFPNARFLLFGKGPLHDDIGARVRQMGLTDRIALPGFRDDLERVLPCLTALAHPAEMEGLGVSLLQASAAGVPIVASAVGGIPEAVVDGVNGCLIPSRDAVALADKLIELLRDPARAKTMGQHGRALVREKFSIDAMTDGNLSVYRDLIVRHS